jgi:hypothetical protein
VEVSRAAKDCTTQKNLVDVTGIEPVTPCLQSRRGKTLKALSGVAYTENWRNFRSLKCPEVVLNFSAPLNFRMRSKRICPRPGESLNHFSPRRFLGHRLTSGPSHRGAAIPLLATPKIFSKPRRERHRSVTFIGHPPTCRLLARALRGVNPLLIHLPESLPSVDTSRGMSRSAVREVQY